MFSYSKIIISKIRVKYGETFGEVLLLDKFAFITHDIDEEKVKISKAEIKADGSLGTVKDSSLDEMEKHLAEAKIPKRVFVKEPIFENLRELFGKDVEVLVTY